MIKTGKPKWPELNINIQFGLFCLEGHAQVKHGFIAILMAVLLRLDHNLGIHPSIYSMVHAKTVSLTVMVLLDARITDGLATI